MLELESFWQGKEEPEVLKEEGEKEKVVVVVVVKVVEENIKKMITWLRAFLIIQEYSQ